MNIVMFDAAYPPPTTGGKEKQAHLLAMELKKQKVQVCVLSHSHHHNVTGLHQGIMVHRVAKNPLAVPRLAAHLAKKRMRSKILHIHTPSRIGLIVSIIGLTLNYRVVFKIPNYIDFSKRTLMQRLMAKIVLSRASLIVILNQRMNRIMLERGIPDKKIFLTDNGVVVPDALSWRHPRSSAVKILFVGRLEEAKRCKDLIAACAMLKSHEGKWQLDVVGDGSCMTQLQKQVRDCGMMAYVTFHGYQADPIQYMQTADIMVLPSIKEGMANVVLEAMSCGLPVIASDVGAIRRQLGMCGEDFIFDATDTRQLAKIIARLIEQPSLRREYGVQLYRRCKDHFAIETISKAYMQRYQSILTER